MTFDPRILEAAQLVVDAAATLDLKVGTVESCTGGLIGGALTAVPGSSAAVERGYITYSNEAKNEVVGVPMETIMAHGAVSGETVRAMAEGALALTPALDAAVAVTGIAGPGGGTPDKPVGLVYMSAARRGAETLVDHRIFPGGRDAVRSATVEFALKLLLRQLS